MLAADVAAVRATVDLNLMGSVDLRQAGGGTMAAQGGRGVDRLDVLGRRPLPPPPLWAYGVAKAGICFRPDAAEELGPSASGSTRWRPGIIDDELMSFITAGGPLLDDYLAQMPLGRSAPSRTWRPRSAG